MVSFYLGSDLLITCLSKIKSLDLYPRNILNEESVFFLALIVGVVFKKAEISCSKMAALRFAITHFTSPPLPPFWVAHSLSRVEEEEEEKDDSAQLGWAVIFDQKIDS